MKIRDALSSVRGRIAPLDARLLLQHVLGFSHAELIARENDPFTDEMAARYLALVRRREAHEPVSRILGMREFFGRDFTVTPAVLDPRPDTETIVELCLERKAQRVLDLGVGSGAILLTLLAEWPEAQGVGADFSADAIAVARRNAEALGVNARATFIHSSWFENIEGKFDLIVSNPPYIASGEIACLDADVREHDPKLALDGGENGLDAYRAIAGGAAAHLAAGGRVVLEIGQGQLGGVQRIFEGQGFRLAEQRADLAGIPRALQFVHT